MTDAHPEYELSLDGVGLSEAFPEVGHCTQIAIFAIPRDRYAPIKGIPQLSPIVAAD